MLKNHEGHEGIINVGWARVSPAHQMPAQIARTPIHLDLHRKPVAKVNHFAHPTIRGVRPYSHPSLNG